MRTLKDMCVNLISVFLLITITYGDKNVVSANSQQASISIKHPDLTNTIVVKPAHTDIQNVTIIPMYRTIFSAISNNAHEEKTIDLSGKWAFQLDPEDKGILEQWYSTQLRDKIKLPGSLQEQGYGEKPSVKTQWTTRIGTQLLSDPRFAEYIQSDDFKSPFWLTPDRYYVGAAWYQKEIEIPNDWSEKRIILFLERPHWQTTVWVDNKQTGICETLGTPHKFNLTDLCKASQKHLITIRVDNSMVVAVGMDAHSVSDQTQSNWNGIAGKIELYTAPNVWLDDIRIFPDITKKQIKVVTKLGNKTGYVGFGSGQITVNALSDNTSIKHLTNTQSFPVTWTEIDREVTFIHKMGDDCLLWDEFSPALYQLQVRLEGEGFETEKNVTFGMREIGIKDKQFTINNKKIFLRGTLECCIFPEHGYPPTDVSEWKRIIGIAKSYGLNHLRFHSWCPPEAAFIAADEMGFYLQPEGSCWAAFGDGTPLDDWNDARRLGLIFEASINGGKLLICAIDIQTDLQNRITARQLRYSLLTYMDSDHFNPQIKLSIEQIQKLF